MKKNKRESESPLSPPKLVSRRENRNSTFRLGRTIGERREKLETANERAAARKKEKRSRIRRIVLTILGFIALAAILVGLFRLFNPEKPDLQSVEPVSRKPTVEIIDENSTTNGQFTSKMLDFIARTEKDLRDLGYSPIKAVIPNGKIREVDFYLSDITGYLKMNIDRGSAISAEDADRMIRYLDGLGVSEYSYIDVRIGGKAYWK